MADALGWRLKLGVIAPSTNTVVQPEFDAMRPAGGTNLAMARLAGEAEFWLDKPVVAINTATYRHALRTNGIADKIAGFGPLLSRY